MNRDDIIRMAREAGIHVYPEFEGAFECFAALVAEHEREACARVCEGIPLPQDIIALTHLPTIERCAAAIRARGQA
jgi:hypothetical protein